MDLGLKGKVAFVAAASKGLGRAVAEELVTILAHDLRNFVSPISGRLQLIARRAAP